MADHPCAADHKKERNALVLRFQNIAQRKHLRISFMSGDVHATANSQFKSTKKIDPSQDPKFMLQSEGNLLASPDMMTRPLMFPILQSSPRPSSTRPRLLRSSGWSRSSAKKLTR